MLTHQELGQFLDQHFGDRLRQRGFIPHPRRPCQWYKVVNQEVLLGFITEPGITAQDGFEVEVAYYPLFMGEFLPYSKSNKENWSDLTTNILTYCPSKPWLAEESYQGYSTEFKESLETCMRQGWLSFHGSPLHPMYYRTTVYYLDCLLEEKVFPILDPIVDVRTCAEQYVRQTEKRMEECKRDPNESTRMRDFWDYRRYLYECIYLENVEECDWYRETKIRPAVQNLSAKVTRLLADDSASEAYKKRIEQAAADYAHLLEGLSEEGYGTLKRELEEKRKLTYQAVKRKLRLQDAP